MDNNNREVLLKVEHLAQYFKSGPSFETKAVDDVSFEIYKGEVFGLVGESGCGKTTTGRTIMKLYDATKGNVYFKGERIVAGLRNYKENIDAAKIDLAKFITEHKDDTAAISAETERVNAYIAEQKKEMELAKHDHKYCDKDHSRRLVAALEKEKEEKLAEAAKGGYTAKLMRDLEAAHKEKLEKENRRYESEMASVNPNKAATSLVEELKAKHEEIVRVEELHFKKKAEEIKNNDPSVLITKDYADKIRVAKRERLINEIQMIFQDPIASLDPRMTVRDIIAEGLIIKGIKDKKYIDEQVYEYLEKVGLVREHAGRYPHEFSGGQRQRIGIARAMIMRPELIIADEPISALDVSIQAQVINLLNDLREELGLTILFIAHDLSVVKYFSDRIGVMYYGNMVEMADSEELFAHPMHPYTKSLLSAIPLPDPNYERRRVRVPYNAVQAHDYRFDKPSFREIAPGHWVKANDAEFEKMKKEYAEQSKK